MIDFSAVLLLDSTGANMTEGLAHKAQKRVVALWLTGTSRAVKRVLMTRARKGGQKERCEAEALKQRVVQAKNANLHECVVGRDGGFVRVITRNR